MNPEALGPLGDRPLSETPGASKPGDLFPGASRFLAARHQERRRAQWDAVRPLAQRLLRPDERLLFVAHAMQVPPVTHTLAFGAWALPFHQVVLVVTDTRMIEVMLDLRGRRAGTRMRSFAWSAVRDLKVGFGRMTLTPAAGRKMAWRVPLRGDRRILEPLIARLRPRFLAEGAGHAQAIPQWHCPQCAAVVSAEPDACSGCRTRFRSKTLATWLSVAFPGAGLLYAGHPFLALGDFLGEIFVFALFVILLLQAAPGMAWVAFAFGALMFAITKIESIHASRILTARARPESEARRSGYGRFALVGGFVSMILVGASFPLAGAARPILDHDLDRSAAGDGWTGSRDRSTWTSFADDPTARSQWKHADGLTLTLFAYPQGILDTPDEFRRRLREELDREGSTMISDDEALSGPQRGFRMITRAVTPDGEPISLINYFLVDRAGRDIHQAVAAVHEEDEAVADGLVRDFIAGVSLGAINPPTGTPAVATNE